MDDLGFDYDEVLSWFRHVDGGGYTLLMIDPIVAADWPTSLCATLRRCYVTDEALEANAAISGRPKSELLAAKLPDPGSTMAGDFGEVLVYLYQGTRLDPQVSIGTKKWRLKQDRTKPAPYSDVVHFSVPEWPRASANDAIYCAEVKVKSTNSNFDPIGAAIHDSAKDRTSRLTRTLLWLRERALHEAIGDVSLEHLDRFINASEFPIHQRVFRAVAVLCSSVLDGELAKVPAPIPAETELVVAVVPNLRTTYGLVFSAVGGSV